MQAVFYSVLLRFYPRPFREEYGGQMRLAFAEQVNRGEAGAAWRQAFADVFTVAPREHGHAILQDLGYTFRGIAARPGFAVVAVLSLALGIGISTAIFSLWSTLVRGKMPLVRDPDRLVILTNPDEMGGWHGSSDGVRSWLTYSEYADLREHANTMSSLMATQASLANWQARFEEGPWEEIRGHLVSGNYFDTLGVTPAMGRAFTVEYERPGTAPYAVISHNFWMRRFGGRADILGKVLTFRRTSLTIVGVAPKGFIGEVVGQNPDLWIPLGMHAGVSPSNDTLYDTPPDKWMWLHVFGRLKPGATVEQAQAQSNSIFKAGLESFYGEVKSEESRRALLDQQLRVQPAGHGASGSRRGFTNSLTIMSTAVGVLLLIACANLANLLLARGASRHSEIALRLSLGASRSRLIRQLITENLVLAIAGGAAAAGLAYLFHGLLTELMRRPNPTLAVGFALDWKVLGFTMAMTLGTAFLFGVLPAWQLTKADAGEALKEQSRSATASVTRTRWGKALVCFQIALSLPLLVATGFLAKTVYEMQNADLGYPQEGLLQVRIDPQEAGYDPPRREALVAALLADFQRIPGVRAASVANNGVFNGSNTIWDIEVEGHAPKDQNERSSGVDMVGPNYFTALGVPILAGRDILETDKAGSVRVAVINEAFAKRFFEGRDPIGLQIASVDDGSERRFEHRIVGVVRNFRTATLQGEIQPRYFIPAAQPFNEANVRSNLLIRMNTDAPLGPVLAAVRETIKQADASVPILVARTIEERIEPQLAGPRAITQLAAGFGGAALLLAAIGLYGVLSYGTASRRGEIAVRIAMGARPGRVVGMILHETSRLILVGLVFGAGLSFAASKLLATALDNLAAPNAAIPLLATSILLTIALIAAYLPARRASRIDPMIALRQE